MATKLFLITFGNQATTHLGNNPVKLNGSASGWYGWQYGLLATAGTSLNSRAANTVAGPTNGVEIDNVGTLPEHWISPPVAADVTISGAITGNIWAAESNMSANVAINFVVDVIRATDNSIVQIVKSARVTEVAVTTRAVNNFTATPGAAVTVNRGDRIRVRIFGDDAGTMGAGFTFNISWNTNAAGLDGDTYITFTETFSFDETAPSGSVLYLTDAASDVATASVDKEAWTARGSGVVTKAVNTAAGFTAPIQWTDGAGGTVLDWFTKPLVAFTLAGVAVGNLWLIESSTTADASARIEIARVDGDGSNPTVWASWCMSPFDSSVGHGEIHSATRAEKFWLSGDDLAVSNGQRLRIRVYLDDNPESGLVTGFTATLAYSGVTGSASGDSYITLAQTISEFISSTVNPPYRNPMIQLLPH